jgi:hypothetical protein
MAGFSTSFYEDPEEEQRRQLLEITGGSAPPAPAPIIDERPELPEFAPQPIEQQAEPIAPTFSPPAADPYAAMAARTQEPTRKQAPQLAPPPMESGTSSGHLIGAGVLDLLLNKGRNAGRFLAALGQGDQSKMENYKRMADHAKNQSALDNAYAYGGRGPRGSDPMAMQARLGNLELRRRQIEMQEESAALKIRLSKPDSAESVRMQEIAIAGGVSPEVAKGKSANELRGLSPAVNEYLKNTGPIGEAKTQQAANTAAATSEARMPFQRTLEEERQANRLALTDVSKANAQEAAATAHERGEAVRAQDFGTQYAKSSEKDLAIAKLIENVENQPGGVAPTMIERAADFLGVTVTSPLLAGERVEGVQAKKMILELWSRSQSGAAISATEDEKFKIQSGSSATASPEQIEASFNVMSQVIQTWLATKAAPNYGAARPIADAAKINADRWLGAPPEGYAPPAPRSRATGRAAPPAPATIDTSGDDWEDE